jgi:hypothetical protein
MVKLVQIDGRGFPDQMRHRGDHAFRMDDIELGFRVAYSLSEEALGFGPLVDLETEIYFRNHPQPEYDD